MTYKSRLGVFNFGHALESPGGAVKCPLCAGSPLRPVTPEPLVWRVASVVFQVPHVRGECGPGGTGSLLKVNLGRIGMALSGHEIKLWEQTMGGNTPVLPGNMTPF